MEPRKASHTCTPNTAVTAAVRATTVAAVEIRARQRAPASAAPLALEPKAPLTPLTPTDTGFTYQGRLKSGGSPANGSYDFTFKLYDDPSAGSQVGPTITTTLVLTEKTVENYVGGVFQALNIDREEPVHPRVKAVLAFLEGTQGT